MLCGMDPTQVLAVRDRCVELNRLPSLAVALTLTANTGVTSSGSPSQTSSSRDDGLVTFFSGLLLGADQQVRTWFSQFVRNGVKKKSGSLQRLRSTMLAKLSDLTVRIRKEGKGAGKDINSLSGVVIQSTALLRLYTGLATYTQSFSVFFVKQR